MYNYQNLRPIRDVASGLGIPDEQLEYYGKYTAKLPLSLIDNPPYPNSGKLILVTAMTPTNHGEGKTVVSIGLAQALARAGKSAIATLREPSLGPVFGLKGGATGGGQAQVLPSEDINLHFNGDFHAVTAAHNLLAACIDSHIHHGNERRIDVDNVFWPRAMDMNDRALRHIIVGLGGKANGIPRETGFVITAASEVMAVLALADSQADLEARLDRIVIGFDLDGHVVRAGDLGVTGALMVLLNQALMPNLVQTTEGTPALIHTGPFANIAHGTCSVLAQKMGLRLAEYVVNECGFGADLGAEKYFDLVMPQSGLKPSAAVLIATVRAIRAHGWDSAGASGDGTGRGAGFANLGKHIENLRKFGVPVVVAVNRFPGDDDTDLATVQQFCRDAGVASAVVAVFEHGGVGALDLACRVTAAAGQAHPSQVQPLYSPELPLERKVETVAREIYGAGAVHFEMAARKKLDRFSALGFGELPVCMAKTQSSFTDRTGAPGAPLGWTLTVTDVHLAAGAGFVVAIAGNMLLMPGLGKTPQAVAMRVDEHGAIVGLH